MKNEKLGLPELSALLTTLNVNGGFSATVVTDSQGFLIAAAAATEDAEAQSAVAAVIQKVATQVSQQLGMQRTDEVSVYDSSGRQLVCRPFSANGQELILAVLLPRRQQSYRRLTNQTIHTICNSWYL